MPDSPIISGDGHGPSDSLETVSNCLFCGGDKSVIAGEAVRDLYFAADPGEFTYLRCLTCRSLWLESRPVGERLAKAYSAYYTHAAPTLAVKRSGLQGVRWGSYIRSRFAASSSLADRLIGWASELLGLNNLYIEEQYRFAPKAPAKVLDYGCGSGQYLLLLEPLGYTLQGAEYDPHLLKELAQRNIRIADVSSVPDAEWQGAFDHITLSHVLEHVPDPLNLLARLFTWLKPGGTLFVEVPNAHATGLDIFGSYWRGLEAPRHFSLPSRTAMIASLESTGFVIDRQHVNSTARRWVWQLCLEAVPSGSRAEYQAAVVAAPPETTENAEYLTFVARKPAN